MSEEDDLKTLKDYVPTWQRDGYGLRGVAEPVARFGSMVEFPRAQIVQAMQPGNEPIVGPESGAGSPSGTPLKYAAFQVVKKQVSGTWYWGVYPGPLYDLRENGGGTLGISGLLATDLSSGFLAMGSRPASIWLKISFTAWPSISSKDIECTGSDTYNGGDIEYESDMDTPPTYTQTFARILLATAENDGDGNPVVTQEHTGALQLMYTGDTGLLSDGTTPQAVPAIYPFGK